MPRASAHLARSAVALSMALALLAASGSPATAHSGAYAESATVLTTSDADTAIVGRDAHQPTSGTGSSTGPFGLLNNKVIDLSKDWREAKVCTGELSTLLRCYDSATEYRASVGLPARDVEILDKNDCSSGWLCLWDDANYRGHWLVAVRYEGTHDIAPYQNRANSVWNRYDGPAQLIDVRTLQPDDTKTMGTGYAYPDLGALNDRFNNRTDKVKLCDPRGC
ncbi:MULTISPECIES: peptidase inhibitor family I36 protein [unclassified Streptosporangium]|uniref:peptidase inhibitor family I36 protein n=1 Tax=unclassified Streptosporangium TaxID=2632669 RepID=UPI002E2C6893|nr:MULTISPECIES: peptidase inhibitor family I36 protein [unclassified Streptosporangium]